MEERLGTEFFKGLEKKTYKVLIARKIIVAKGMLVDSTALFIGERNIKENIISVG